MCEVRTRMYEYTSVYQRFVARVRYGYDCVSVHMCQQECVSVHGGGNCTDTVVTVLFVRNSWMTYGL